MKEKQIINKLTILKIMQPQQSTLNEIKKGVYRQIHMKNRVHSSFRFLELFEQIQSLVRSSAFAFYGISVALLLILFLSFSSFFLPIHFHTAIMYIRLSLTTNQYLKAQIALVDTTSRFQTNTSISQYDQEFSQSLALTNAELNRLKLKGEKGQYTAKECHQLYITYRNYLEKMKKNIPANTLTHAQVRNHVNMFEEQAEVKLHMYDNL